MQRNAITSWTLLQPKPEIILFGDEEGTGEICREFNLRHVPGIARNEFGTPLLNDLFEKAKALAKYDLLCYMNADLIVTQSLIEAVNIVCQRWRRFVLSCCSRDLLMEDKIDFTSPNWEDKLRNLVQKEGRPPFVGIDLFLFPRDFYHRIPPFNIGRMCWDNWFVFKICSAKIPFIDATPFILNVHPDHKDSTHSRTKDRTERVIKEDFINQRLAGWWACTYSILDANYVLGEDRRLRKKRTFELFKLRIKALRLAPVLLRIRPRQKMRYFLRKMGFDAR